MHERMDWQNISDPTEKRGAYYTSREWGLKKQAVRGRCNGICERCNVNAMDHVHHLTYVRLYDEPLEDLQGLCRPCHDYTHGKSDVDPLKPAPFPRMQQWDLMRLDVAGLAIFDTRHSHGDIDVALVCPTCGGRCNHLQWVRTWPGLDKGNASEVYDSGVRGDVTAIAFMGECGHVWRLVFSFHKGTIYVKTSLPDPYAEAEAEVPE